MKRPITLFIIAVVLAGLSFNTHAVVRFGVKGGLTVNELKWDKDVVSSQNRAGFTAGVMLEVGLPVVGLGIDASALYAHRENEMIHDGEKLKRDYADFPINVKYKLQIPVLEKVIAPFVTTGPDFSLLLSDKDTGDFKTRKWNTSWNVGVGAELFKKLQVHANYGIGVTKAFEYIGKDVEEKSVKGKDKYWTITATYFF